MLYPVVSPMVWGQHAVGAVDHHFMELTWVLGVLALGLAWAKDLNSAPKALLLGAALGLALFFHHGLFVLQLPLDAWLLLLWLRGGGPQRSVAWLALGLLAGTLLACLPSPQFQAGLFSAYFLSWFHLYAAGASALMLLLMARLGPSPRALLLLGLAGAGLLLLMLGQIRSGLAFVTGQTLLLDQVDETVGLLQKVQNGEGLRMLKAFTLLMPLALPFTLWLAWTQRTQPAGLWLAVFALFGLAMFFVQVRFHYMALPAFVFPAMSAAQAWVRGVPSAGERRYRVGAAAVMAGLAYLPSLGALPHLATGGSRHYATGHPLFMALQAECAKDPGVVLTDYEYGHFIRYHTACGVIGNSMMLTPLQQRKIEQGRALLNASLGQVLAEGNWIRYLLVRRSPQQGDGMLQSRLLRGDARPPAGLELLGETRMHDRLGRLRPYARLYRIPRPWSEQSAPPHTQDTDQEAGQ